MFIISHKRFVCFVHGHRHSPKRYWGRIVYILFLWYFAAINAPKHKWNSAFLFYFAVHHSRWKRHVKRIIWFPVRYMSLRFFKAIVARSTFPKPLQKSCSDVEVTPFAPKVQLGPQWVWPHDSEETPDAAGLFEGRHLAFTSFCENFKVENLESKKTLHTPLRDQTGWQISLESSNLQSKSCCDMPKVSKCECEKNDKKNFSMRFSQSRPP